MKEVGARGQWIIALVLIACDAEPAASEGSDGDDGEPMLLPRHCPPPPDAPTRPRSIEDVVDLINALPKPTSLPCFLESLERPLRIAATSHDFSAQPASGEATPRMFLFAEPLVLSVVPAGTGSELLEMAQDIGSSRSIKAELEFPIEAALDYAAPFQRPDLGEMSTCVGCHPNETPWPAVEYATAWVSDALQPPSDTMVPAAFVRQHQLDCDAATERQRCAMLDALFGHGPTESASFPATHRFCIAP